MSEGHLKWRKDIIVAESPDTAVFKDDLVTESSFRARHLLTPSVVAP